MDVSRELTIVVRWDGEEAPNESWTRMVDELAAFVSSNSVGDHFAGETGERDGVFAACCVSSFLESEIPIVVEKAREIVAKAGKCSVGFGKSKIAWTEL